MIATKYIADDRTKGIARDMTDVSNKTRKRHPRARKLWCIAMVVALAFIAGVVQNKTNVAADAPGQSPAMASPTATTCQNLTNLTLPNATVRATLLRRIRLQRTHVPSSRPL